jgi:hypothetical protein
MNTNINIPVIEIKNVEKKSALIQVLPVIRPLEPNI